MKPGAKRQIGWIGLAVLMALPAGGAARAAETAAAPAAPAVSAATGPAAAAEAAALAEEIAVLRAVKALRATPEQLAALEAAARGAQERLTQQTQTDWKTLAALRDPVLQARARLLPLQADPNDPRVVAALGVDQRVSDAQRAAARAQQGLRDELTNSLLQQFETLLTPAQRAAVVGQGRGLVMADRAAQDQQRQARQQQWQRTMGAAGGPAGGPGGPGGGPGGGGQAGGGRNNPSRMLDRMRGANADDYQRMSRGIARRFGDEGTPGYQNALTMMDQTRNMSPGQFRRQAGNLGSQMSAAMAAARSPQNAAYTISAQNAAEAWVRRYLLSPRAPAALKELKG